ncbi:hypothetical protein Q7P36_008946 [Cladosporium allicinum]
MQTVIGSLIIATKAVHFGEFLAELDSQLSLAYKRKLFKSRKLNLVSVIALATIFDSALDCFKHVKVAKSFGSDYQTCVLRLQNIQLRLSRWEELANKYAGSPSDLVAIDEDTHGLDDTAKLCQKMRDICLRRQRQTDVTKKVKWSLFSRERFIELVDNIQKLIDDLENVFPAEARVSKEADLCQQEASELRDEKALLELRMIALKQDTLLAKAIGKLAHKHFSKTTSFTNNMRDNAKILNQTENMTINGGQNVTF